MAQAFCAVCSGGKTNHFNHVSRDVIMYSRENKIEILCLPAHTTHILQPLDIVVFNALKAVFSTMASRMGLVQGDLVVGKKQFSSLLKAVYPTAVTALNIKAGFRTSSLCLGGLWTQPR